MCLILRFLSLDSYVSTHLETRLLKMYNARDHLQAFRYTFEISDLIRVLEAMSTGDEVCRLDTVT